MSLPDLQNVIASLVRGAGGCVPDGALSPAERDYFSALQEDPGFRFTLNVQKPWRAGRAAKAAFLTLSVLPAELRQLFLDEWISLGGGTQSFTGAESGAFLKFIRERLPDPSHERTACDLELAALRANEGARQFEWPDPSELDARPCLLKRGQHGALVHFHGHPDQVIRALLQHNPLPVIPNAAAVLFGPGLDSLHRSASRSEVILYERLTDPSPAADLLSEGFHREVIEGLLLGGVLEYARR